MTLYHHYKVQINRAKDHIYIYTRNQVHIGGQNTAGCTNGPIKVYLSTINLYKKIACPQKMKSIDTIMFI